jgi:hypothetical protein
MYTYKPNTRHLNNSIIYEGILLRFYSKTVHNTGARDGVVVKALCYKPAGRGFDSRWCHWNFSVT